MLDPAELEAIDRLRALYERERALRAEPGDLTHARRRLAELEGRITELREGATGTFPRGWRASVLRDGC